MSARFQGDLDKAREVIQCEADALQRMAENLDHQFSRAVELLLACRGNIIVLAVGKSGYVGQKISATLASTGAPSHFVHPAEAVHGDLGRIRSDDVALILSHSGETAEITTILPSLKEFNVPIIAITGRAKSTLAKAAAVPLLTGKLAEACSLDLAPSTSTTVMMALGDALALVLSDRRGFQKEDFARYHPGGSLGRKLAKVQDVMRPLDECRVALECDAVRRALSTLSRPGRRSGAIMAVDTRGILTGIFTDSDLARLLETRQEAALDGPLRNVMTAKPQVVVEGSPLSEAIALIAELKISELPVITTEGRLLGLVDITDILPEGVAPREADSQPIALPIAISAATTSTPLDC